MCNILTVKNCRAVLQTIRSGVMRRRTNNPDNNVSVSSLGSVTNELDITAETPRNQSCTHSIKSFIPLIRTTEEELRAHKAIYDLLAELEVLANSKACLLKHIEALKAEEEFLEERKKQNEIEVNRRFNDSALRMEKALEQEKLYEKALEQKKLDEKALEDKKAVELSIVLNRAEEKATGKALVDKAAEKAIKLDVLETKIKLEVLEKVVEKIAADKACELKTIEKRSKAALQQELRQAVEQLKAEYLLEPKVEQEDIEEINMNRSTDSAFKSCIRNAVSKGPGKKVVFCDDVKVKYIRSTKNDIYLINPIEDDFETSAEDLQALHDNAKALAPHIDLKKPHIIIVPKQKVVEQSDNNKSDDLLSIYSIKIVPQPLIVEEPTPTQFILPKQSSLVQPLFTLESPGRSELTIRFVDYDIDEKNRSIRCSVKIRFMHRELKIIYARTTMNDWLSYTDTMATYVSSESTVKRGMHFDRFEYFDIIIKLPDVVPARIEMAVCYEGGWPYGFSHLNWDNNCGQNFSFLVHGE